MLKVFNFLNLIYVSFLLFFFYSKVGFLERVYEVISWLILFEEEKFDFIILYFDELDYVGYGGGSESEGVSD